MKNIYKPKYDLHDIVKEILFMVGNTNPGYESLCKELFEEMDKWGKPTPVEKEV